MRVTERFTRKDYALLPEGFPAELIGGQLVREAQPLYGHQRVAGAFYRRLCRLVDPIRVAFSPVDVPIDDWNVFQPDVVVLREALPDDARDVGIPLLAVEVLSPSTQRRDRGVKRRRLLRAGVAEVWIVDPETRAIEVHDADGCRTASGQERVTSNAVAGFDLSPTDLWPARA